MFCMSYMTYTIPANRLLLNHYRSRQRTPTLSARRLICVARYPAPYPLSIFTTAMPFAQEFIIVSSADNPCILAPYPTEVGTAMTGLLTSPPITLASAPYIPATATTQFASCIVSVCANSLCRPLTPTS